MLGGSLTLSWNEIRKRAIEFSREWEGETRESAEAQTFWNEFLNIFGISRRRRGVLFERTVQLLGDRRGSIDLFWKGTLVVEHKSAGQNLDSAFIQATEYLEGIEDYELPKYILVSDFNRFKLRDLDNNQEYEFEISDLHDKIHLFGFIIGHTRRSYEDEDPVNIKAAELMGKLHDSLKENGYEGHFLEVLLVRLMFCLFADDTGIFDKGHFTYYVENKTNEDGSDLGQYLKTVFEVLDKKEDERQRNLDEDLAKFPYINGRLFEERLPTPAFDSDGRKLLLNACYFDWSGISPAIFGSLFQSVMNPEERRELGAHYTTEKNILKTIDGLFLNDLVEYFNSHKRNKRYLKELLEKISKIKLLDPACGCGNFLIIAYRELRKLEVEIHKQIMKLERRGGQQVLDIRGVFDKGINVDSIYGIEVLEFPVRIAETALWLVDHQVNVDISKEFGQYYVRLPLVKNPKILQGNAIQMDWEEFVPKDELSYILGNPPYVGKKRRSKEQNEDMKLVFNGVKNYGTLDYVCCWYLKATEYIQGTEIKVAFVSTNSITQGEQVGILWDHLLNEKNIKIHFVHRTFKWFSEAKGKANVFVVIIGFGNFDTNKKYIHDYETPNSNPVEIKVSNINPYLVDQKDIIIKNRSKPISVVPKISYGNMPLDDGNFLFNDSEKVQFLNNEPHAKKFIRPFISAKQFLNNTKRWCLWLKDANPSEIRNLSDVKERIRKVKEYRLKSKREATIELAKTPYLFAFYSQPTAGDYILIPRHSSENRTYIPMGFLSFENIVGDSCCIVKNAGLYDFGVLTSTMHMAWMRQVCGRLEGRFRYSNKLVYNNFPWPENPSDKQIKDVKKRAKQVLDVRKEFSDSSLADLYDPLSMPPKLLRAHKKLDRAVDKCYRSKAFNMELDRLKFLFEMYDKSLEVT